MTSEKKWKKIDRENEDWFWDQVPKVSWAKGRTRREILNENKKPTMEA